MPRLTALDPLRPVDPTRRIGRLSRYNGRSCSRIGRREFGQSRHRRIGDGKAATGWFPDIRSLAIVNARSHCKPMRTFVQGRFFNELTAGKRLTRLRMSAARSSGSSIAAKWPPRGMSVHCATLNTRSSHTRGGWPISSGKCAKLTSGNTRCPGAKRLGCNRFSQYI